VENETRFLRKYHCESRDSHESREKGKMRYAIYYEAYESRNLRDTQSSRITIYCKKLDPKFSQDSCKTPGLKLVLILTSLAMKFLFARLVRSKSFYKIFLRDSREASLAMKFLSARLVRSKSHSKICLQDLREASLATKFQSVRPVRSESRY
jgi:hypothetical protein